jgi:hypothetical protein
MACSSLSNQCLSHKPKTSKKSSREQTPSSPSDWSGSGGQELGFHHGFERGGDGEEMNDGEGERW